MNTVLTSDATLAETISTPERAAGELKPGWRVVRFGDVVRNVDVAERKPLENDLERLVGLEHLDPESLHIKRWGLIAEGTSFTRKFVRGQVLFGKRRAYQRKAAVAEWDGICSGDILVFEPKGHELLAELLPFIVQSDGFFEHALGTSAGSLSPRTKWSDLARYEFALPPKDEQRRIADILWAADDAIEARLIVLKKLKQLKNALMKDFYHFGKTDKHKSNDWQMGLLSDLVTLNPKPLLKIDDDLEVSFVTMADVSENGKLLNQIKRKVGEVKKGFTYFEDNDVLFAKITPCMENGKGALAKNLISAVGFGSTEFFVLRAKRSDDATFIYHLTMFEDFRREAKRHMRGSAGQQRVTREFLEELPILIPPQNARTQISKLLDVHDASIDAQNINVEKLRSLKKNMLREFFKN